MEEKNYTLTEKEFVNVLAHAFSLGRKIALEGLTEGAKEDRLPTLGDLETMDSIFEETEKSLRKKVQYVFDHKEIYKKVEETENLETLLAFLKAVLHCLPAEDLETWKDNLQ